METDFQSDLGARIARQRRAVYLTQEQLAERIGVQQATISRWENGVSAPALRHRMPLAQALLISPHLLFGPEEVAA